MTTAHATERAARASGRTAARVALGLCAVGALVSAAWSLSGLADAPGDTLLAEAWRGWGYVVFAGLFVLLATRTLPGAVWLLVILHKAAMTSTAALLVLSGSQAPGATTVAVADGAVTLLLVWAYLLSRPGTHH